MPQPTGRRTLLGVAAGGLLAAGLPRPSLGAPLRRHEPFTFLFITDAHIQPELDAAAGTALCFDKAARIPADFAIQGGDHVFDALGVARTRAIDLAGLYDRTEHRLGMRVHHAIGNHDLLGIYARSGVEPSDPLYGKKFFQDRWGPLHYAFDYKGVHLVVLDSIGVTPDRDYQGLVDAEQVDWLRNDLDRLPAGTPVILVSHVPLVTAFPCYGDPNPKVAAAIPRHQISVANAPDVLHLLRGHNVLGVLQGHTHVNETVWWQGIPFITGGAVSGNWWHGTHLGTPEGFTVVEVRDNRLLTRYETYGFRSVDPQNS
ncbi:metallophosphoesterase family protein [Rhizosaccharibacter radicis]|uniref:Metallophosphoesterase n=1 Tax=Rhizosaccharibacter radicis TaxID=2782605 RepID=A0ABT1VVF3_9PROT|nr:metallophosphoesterase [Acetobacteraceae bacterium KSS12]